MRERGVCVCALCAVRIQVVRKSRELYSLPSLANRLWLASTYRIRWANFRHQYVYLITFRRRAARESKRKSISYLSSGMKCIKNLWQTRNRSRETKTPTNRVETHDGVFSVHIQATTKIGLKLTRFWSTGRILSIWRARLLFWPQPQMNEWTVSQKNTNRTRIGGHETGPSPSQSFMPKTHCQSPSSTTSGAITCPAQHKSINSKNRSEFLFRAKRERARFFRFHSSPQWNCNPWYRITACHGNKRGNV